MKGIIMKDFKHLVLSRKAGDSISITLSPNIPAATPIGELFDEILITVDSVGGRAAKVCISATEDFKIMREELL
jgi:sRNA-binding carbon storage regulator CsrA